MVVDDEFQLPLKTAFLALLLYALPGTLFFWLWETDWGLVGSLYFFFVSTSTIGFGDLVPGVRWTMSTPQMKLNSR